LARPEPQRPNARLDANGAPSPAAAREPGPPALQQQGQALRDALEAGDAKRAGRRLIAGDELVGHGQWSVARRCAHEVRPNRTPGDRVDFTETVFWNAGIRTDKDSGEAIIEFGLPDSVTSFRVMADAFTSEGALGEAAKSIEVVEPFYIEPKPPLE